MIWSSEKKHWRKICYNRKCSGKWNYYRKTTIFFTDADVQSGNYSYRLKQVDFNGAYEYSNEIFVDVPAPLEFALGQNYSNPFNPTTTINFSLAEPTFIKLAIYNLLGEELEILKNENMNAGSYNVSFDATSLPSGMYLYKIETVQFSSVRKMMLMK